VTPFLSRPSNTHVICDQIVVACAMEVMSPKPGNVGPGSEFANASVDDFLRSAHAIAPILATGGKQALGAKILDAVQATRKVVDHNTNLGIVLLLAPLAAVPHDQLLRDGIGAVLNSTTIADSRRVYQAIRAAQPSGLGEASEQDLNEEPTLNLLECMKLAADRDMIAAQYANGFHDVLTTGQDYLRECSQLANSQPQQISMLAVRLLAEFGDSLIARKCGLEMSNVVRGKARALLDNGWPMQHDTGQQYAAFDGFLRSDGNRRNPGTTADLVAAILFSALREGLMTAEGDWFQRSIDS